MNLDEFHILIDRCIAETITPTQHDALQTVLKQDPKARAIFRERMDLEAALDTWARQSAPLEQPASAPPALPRWRQHPWAAAATLLILFSAAWMIFTSPATPTTPITPRPPIVATLGSLVEQDDCTWASAPTLGPDGQLRTGTFRLQSGGAMLELDSGTTLLAEGPCEFELASGIEATLLRGNVTVHVTDASDGFVLRTPDATIIDEGTEYAVACDGDTTEVHVFDGSVIYYADDDGDGERIDASQARCFQRGPRGQGAKIPFGKREFLRPKGDHRFQPGRGFPKPPHRKPSRRRGLTPEQKRKLHTLRAKFKGHGDFKRKALGLSDEQHAKLGAARKVAEQATREIEDPQDRADAIRRSMRTAMEAILTDEQKAKLQQLREQQKRQLRDKPAPQRPNGGTPLRPRRPHRPSERSDEWSKPPRPEGAGFPHGPFPRE